MAASKYQGIDIPSKLFVNNEVCLVGQKYCMHKS